MTKTAFRLWMAVLLSVLLISTPGQAPPVLAQDSTPTATLTETPPVEQTTPTSTIEIPTETPAAEITETEPPAITETPAATETLAPEVTETITETATPTVTPTPTETPEFDGQENLEAVSYSGTRTINAPYLNSGNIASERYSEMAVFWFGKINLSQNYTDVRVAYNDSAVVIQANVVDRLFWYDKKANPANLTKSDAVSIYLNVGKPESGSPSSQAFRFTAGLNWWEDHSLYQASFRGNGSGWAAENIPFTSKQGFSGAQFNNTKSNRGWAMTFNIPYSSLGVSGRPADGSVWGLSVVVHDRDAGTINRAKYWPETFTKSNPSSWGRMRFGMPGYHPSANSGGDTVTIRHGLNGTVVTDAGVGGDLGNLCNASDLWTAWGNRNFAGKDSVNIQNQGYVGDWPCFARFYINFPLGKIPEGKVIVSAKLVMHEWGGSNFSEARPSLLQVSTVNKAWSESSLTWNNSPMALENVSQTWVNPMNHVIEPDEWPGVRSEWDVSRAVAQSYSKGIPLQLAIYEADAAFHSGKYFSTSNTGKWNSSGRPTLIVQWGDPQ